MEGPFEPDLTLQPGELIAVVTYGDETARLTHGELLQFEPLVLRITEPDPLPFLPEGKAMLIVRGITPPWRGRTTVASCEPDGGALVVAFNETSWEMEDRRKFPRVPVRLPVELRLVHEQPESLSFTEAKGITEDLSLGGAWLKMETPVPVGTLVEFRWSPEPGKTVRSLAIVLHEKPEHQGGVGIEFVNFIGEGKSALATFLDKAA